MAVKADRENRDSKYSGDSDKFITAFSDASWADGIFGYAVWIKSKEGVFKHFAGGLCDRPNLAERIGLEFIINHLKTLNLTSRIIVIQCDCLGELNNLDVAPLYVAGAVHVKKKHVKGHSGQDTKRSSVNEWCDKNARKARIEFVNRRVIG